MNCRETENRLTAYLAGKLDEKTRLDIKSHIDSCKNCQTELELLKTIENSLEKWNALDTSMDFESILQQKLEIAKKDVKRSYARFAFISAGGIAVCAIAVIYIYSMISFQPTGSVIPELKKSYAVESLTGVSYLTSHNKRKVLAVSDMISEGDSVETEKKAEINVVMSENSRFRLKENSILCVKKSIEKDGNENYNFELLKGQIMCKAEKTEKSLDFEVKTLNSKVEVSGTLFKVSCLDKADSQILVAEGTVKVSKLSNSETCNISKGNSIEVKEKEQLVPLKAKENEKIELYEIAVSPLLLGNMPESENPPEQSMAKVDEKLTHGRIFGIVEDKGEDWVLVVSSNGKAACYKTKSQETIDILDKLAIGSTVEIRWKFYNQLIAEDIDLIK